jgi:hypothetical protein
LGFVVFSRSCLWLWRAVGVLVLWCYGFGVFWSLLYLKAWVGGGFYGGVASPGALLSPGVLVGNFEQCRSVWRYFLIMEKIEPPPPTPRQDGNGFCVG